MEWPIDPLLLSCVRARYHQEALDEARHMVRKGDVDWEQFLRQTLRHNVGPLVHDTLRVNDEILPPWVKEELRSTYYQAAARNTTFYEELAAIVRAFDEENLPLILLKGAALAQGTYENVALRPMGDLDLLVRGEMMPRAEQLFSRKGYLVLAGADSHSRHMTLRHPDSASGAHVEVHRHIVSSAYYRRAIPEEWLWRDSVQLPIDGVPARTLSPEASVIHCCLHFLDHTGTRGALLWLCDIAEIARRANLDWNGLADTLNRFRIVLPVRSVMLTCHELLGLPIPPHSLQEILSLRPGFVEQKAYQFCLSSQRSQASKTLFDVLATRGLQNRVRLLASRLFPSPEYMESRYSIRHNWLVPLYYPRMILEATLNGLRALRNPHRH